MTTSSPLDLVLGKLQNVQETGSGYVALCPAHNDQSPSLSVTVGDDGQLLIHCFAGCRFETILEQLGLEARDLFPNGAQGTGSSEGLTVEELSVAKHLPTPFLLKHGLSDYKHRGRVSVKIPYYDLDGEISAMRSRHALEGSGRFTWRKGDRASLYGLDHLRDIREAGWVLLVEGESDCWTGWFHGLPVVGVPGKSIWRKEWAAHLEGLGVYLWQEPHAEDLTMRVANDLPDLHVITAPEGIKDLSAAHIQGEDVPALIERLRLEAISAHVIREAQRAAQYDELRTRAESVLTAPDPLQRIGAAMRALGFGGDLRSPVTVYLAATSRVLGVRAGTMLPHLLLLGPPSAGKSYTAKVALRLLPGGCYKVIDAGSPRVLIYMDADLRHKVLVYGEADSLPAGEDNPAASAIRNLLQDNVLSYEVVRPDPVSGDFRVQDIHKDGPTVLVTTAVKSLGDQLMTRLFVLEVPDDPGHMRSALAAQGALEVEGAPEVDDALLAFQEYLQVLAPWEVVVPFAPRLSEAIGRSRTAPRILRDYQRLLSLIKAVAVIRHVHRARDVNGRLVATLKDYRTVRELTNTMYEGSASGASRLVRDTVAAVETLLKQNASETTVSAKQVVDHLGIDKSAVSRRLGNALKEGWLVNEESRRGRPMRLLLGDALPAMGGLPLPEDLEPVDSPSDDGGGGGSSTVNGATAQPSDADPHAPDGSRGYFREPVVEAEDSGCAVAGDTDDDPSSSPSIEKDTGALPENWQPQTVLVTDLLQLEQWHPQLQASSCIAVDVETTGLNPRTDQLCVVTLAIPEVTLVVDVRAMPGWEDALTPILADEHILKIAHNAGFDVAFLMRAGLVVNNLADTWLVSQLLDGGQNLREKVPDPAGRSTKPIGYHTLAALAYRELGVVLDKSLQTATWDGPLSEEMIGYAATDAAVLLPLYDRLAGKLTAAGLDQVAAIEFGAVPAIVWTESAGVPIDADAWRALRDEAATKKERLSAAIAEVLPGVNLNSSLQLKAASAGLGVHVPDTKEATLKAFASQHPVIVLIVDWKATAKLVGTYGDGYLKHVDPETGRIHANYFQIGAASGRMSCASPNIQNIPRTSAYRGAIRPREGRVFIRADYSQIELRIAAQLSGDVAMRRAFREGEDLHTMTARSVLGREPSSEDRRLAKALNFGLIYGMGPKGLQQYAKDDYGVALTAGEAERFRERFFDTYRGIRDWHHRQLDGLVTTRTLAGRTRRGVSSFTEKLNSPVQGTGADILKLALGRIWSDRSAVSSAVPVAVVHDEILLEVDVAEAGAAAQWLQHHMEAAGQDLLPDVLVVVEVAIVADWSGTPFQSASQTETDDASSKAAG